MAQESPPAWAARSVGMVGLTLFAVLLLVPHRSTALLVADLGLVALIGLAVSAHLFVHRRSPRAEPPGSTAPGDRPHA